MVHAFLTQFGLEVNVAQAPSKSKAVVRQRSTAGKAVSKSEASKASPPGHADAIGGYFARFGSFILTSDADGGLADARERMVLALSDDTRVEDLVAGDLREPWSHRLRVFPVDEPSSESDLLDGNDIRVGFFWSPFLTFKVHVPKRHQPLFKETEDLPGSDYFVVWDGVTAIVLWPRGRGVHRPPKSGGHVVVEVLQDAAVRAGLMLVVQACSSGCDNLFAHPVLHVTQFPGPEEPTNYRSIEKLVIDAHLHVDGGAPEVVEKLGKSILYSAHWFARFKNVSRRILDLEYTARGMVDELLTLDFNRNRTQGRNVLLRLLFGFVEWAQGLAGRGAKVRSRALISSLWLAMSVIELLKRDWLKEQRAFQNSSKGRGRPRLWRVDTKDDDADVLSIDLAFIRSAVEQKSTRLDTSIVVWATLFGGVVAAAVAVVVQFVSSSGK
jgi:hypothetical protein